MNIACAFALLMSTFISFTSKLKTFLRANPVRARFIGMFSEIIQKITMAGLSEAEIARRVGVNQSTIHRLRTGKTTDPTYSVGSKLIILRAKVRRRKKCK